MQHIVHHLSGQGPPRKSFHPPLRPSMSNPHAPPAGYPAAPGGTPPPAHAAPASPAPYALPPAHVSPPRTGAQPASPFSQMQPPYYSQPHVVGTPTAAPGPYASQPFSSQPPQPFTSQSFSSQPYTSQPFAPSPVSFSHSPYQQPAPGPPAGYAYAAAPPGYAQAYPNYAPGGYQQGPPPGYQQHPAAPGYVQHAAYYAPQPPAEMHGGYPYGGPGGYATYSTAIPTSTGYGAWAGSSTSSLPYGPGSSYGNATAPSLAAMGGSPANSGGVAQISVDASGLPAVAGDTPGDTSRTVRLHVEEKVLDGTGDGFYVKESRRTRYRVEGSRTTDQYKCLKDARGLALLQMRQTSTFKSKMAISDMSGNPLLTLVRQAGVAKRVHGFLGGKAEGRPAVVIVGNANSQTFHIENGREHVVAQITRSVHSFKRRLTGQDSYTVDVHSGSAALVAMLTVAIDEIFCDAND